MLRKFYGFRRAMVQFQYARITNDPRNQEGFGQNLGDKIKDTAQSAWDQAKDKASGSQKETSYDQKTDYNLNKGQEQRDRQQDWGQGSGTQYQGSGSGMTGSSNRAGGGVSYGHDSSKYVESSNPSNFDPLYQKFDSQSGQAGYNKDLKSQSSSYGTGSSSQIVDDKDLYQSQTQKEQWGQSSGNLNQKTMSGQSSTFGQGSSGGTDFSQSSGKQNLGSGSSAFGASYDQKSNLQQNTTNAGFVKSSEYTDKGYGAQVGRNQSQQQDKSYSGGTHFDQPLGRDDLNDLKAGSGGSSSYNWSSSDQQRTQSSSSQNLNKDQQKWGSQGQGQGQGQYQEGFTQKIQENVGKAAENVKDMAGNVTHKVAENVKDMAGNVGHKIMEGIHTAQEKLKDVVGSSDKNKKQ